MPGRALLPVFLILSSFAIAASAQIVVTGTVVDPSGGAVAGATVLLHGATAKTDDLGRFRIENVPPGRIAWMLPPAMPSSRCAAT